MSPPIRDGSGDSIGAIRLGDGSEISEVRTGAGDVLFSGSAIPDSALTQDLVAWYRFEDGDARDYASSGEFPSVTWGDSTAFDGTVNGATFQSNGGVTDFETGGNSGAFDFDGNDYIDIDTSFTLPEEYTFSVWFNYRSLDAGDFYLLENIEVNNNDPLFYYNDDQELRILVDSTGLVDAPVSLNQGEWHHAVFTDDGSETKIYHNGTDIGTAGTQNLNYSGDWYLGTANGLEGPTDGLIDDVRIYNRALTASEISDIYNSTEP